MAEGPRLSIRARFALAVTVTLLTLGGAMLLAVALVMRYVPTYNLRAAGSLTASSTDALAATPASTSTLPGVVISSASDVLGTLLIVSAIALVVIGAIGAGVSWLVAGRMLRPLRSLTVAAERAATGALDHRVGLARDDEFGRLATTFDTMLDRLERSFTAQRRFAANASHELRTPLATTKTIIDVALDEMPNDPRGVLEQLEATNRRSIEVVEAMLDLSDIDRMAIPRDPVELAALVREEVELMREEAAGRDLRIVTMLEPVVVQGDAALLRRLAANLIGNAVVHNVPGGIVTVTTGGSSCALVVAGTGDPVPQETLRLLAEPFYRVRGRVQGNGDRHGLGLALVAAIVDAHGGGLDIQAPADGGLRVAVQLPRGSLSRGHPLFTEGDDGV